MRRGLLILKAGIEGNCLRVLVALVATDEQIDESLDVFAEAVAEALGAEAPMAAATPVKIFSDGQAGSCHCRCS